MLSRTKVLIEVTGVWAVLFAIMALLMTLFFAPYILKPHKHFCDAGDCIAISAPESAARTLYEPAIPQ